MDDHPYRLNIAGQAQVVWLEPGLSLFKAAKAAAIKLGCEVSTSAPPEGWPKLSDLCPSTPDLVNIEMPIIEQSPISDSLQDEIPVDDSTLLAKSTIAELRKILKK